MSYRSRRGAPNRYASLPSLSNASGSIGTSGNNYKSEQTAVRRHEFLTPISGLASLALGDFAQVVLCRFKRSFGVGADENPTPTASNNYQSAAVMNGSAIRGYSAKIQIQNIGSGNPIVLDVYSVVTSFSDSVYGKLVYDGDYPVEMDETIPNEGEVQFSSPPITWTANTYRNFKGVQRDVKFLGSLTITSEDGGSPTVTFLIRGVPPKCRRSNNGMFYGLMFHYPSTKNTDATATMDSSIDIKFDEIPSSERVPFKW